MIENKNLSNSAIRVFRILKKLMLSDCSKTELLDDFSDDSLLFYINTLKKAEILPKNGKVITPEQSIKKIMKLNMFFVNTSGWFIKIDNEYCKMMQNECYTIVDDTPTTKTFKNNKNQLVKTKHIESYNWSKFELINE